MQEYDGRDESENQPLQTGQRYRFHLAECTTPESRDKGAKKEMMSRTDKRGECYLCGKPATTKDHIPPLGLFPKPRPNNLITVPACDTCNHNRSLDDEYFRVIVAAGSRDSQQSTVLLHQRIIPRLREKPALILDFLKSVRPMDIQSNGGIYLRRGYTFTFDPPRIQTVIDKIVRGLFFKHANRRLADDYSVEEFIYCPKIEKPLQEVIMQLPLFNIGDGSVFSYRYHLAGAASSESFWFLMFYSDTTLIITRTSQTDGRLAR